MFSNLIRKFWLFVSSRDKDSIEERNRTIFRIVDELVITSNVNAQHQLLLDVGSCTRELPRYFSPIFGEMVLLDISREQLKKAKSMLPNSWCVCADAHYLPFRDSAFSQLHAFSLIEHLSQPERFLCEALRVLKEKGLLIAQIPNPNFLVELDAGVPFPSFLPCAIKDRILKNAFPGAYVNWSLTRSTLVHQLNKMFANIKSYEFSYPEEAASNLTRPFLKIAKRLRLLNIVPMGYLLGRPKKKGL